MTWVSRIGTQVTLTAVDEAGATIGSATIDGDLRSLAIKRGREKGTERMGAGTCNLQLVAPASEGDWTARNAAGDPLWLGSRLNVKARVDGGAYRDLFVGHVRALADEFQRDGRLLIKVSAVDRLGALAAVVPDPDELSTVQSVVARLLYINGLAPGATGNAWGSATDFGAPGSINVQATHMTRNLLDEAMLAAESENGELWPGQISGLRYRSREQLEAMSTYATEQLTWANIPLTTSLWDTATWDSGKWSAEAAITLGTTTFSTETDTEELINRVSLMRVGGTAMTYADPEGVHGRRTYERTDLIPTTDEPLRARALWLLRQGSTRTARINKLTALLDPAMSAATLNQLLLVDLLDRQRLVWDDGSGAAPFDMAAHVQGIEMTVTPELWQLAVTLWQYN